LGGLGAREGIPVTHTWAPPPPPPTRIVAAASTGAKLIVALLLLLPLFLSRPNRTPAAWWIWLPIAIAVVLAAALIALFWDGEPILLQVIFAFLAGLAAVWLLTPYLKSRYRIVMFFKTLPLLAAFSLLAYVPILLGRYEGWLDVRTYFVVVLAVASLPATLAITLVGLSVRRRFGRMRFLFWLAVCTVLAWTAFATPFAIFSLLGSAPEWGEFIIAVSVVSGITFALFLPFVLLAFFQPFYRDRFRDWLNLPQPAPPAGMAVPAKLAEAERAGAATPVA
jgi:hypothetical protein